MSFQEKYESVLLKISLDSFLEEPVIIRSDNLKGDQIRNYQLNNILYLPIPNKKKLSIYYNNSMADIKIQPLLQYINCIHSIRVQTYSDQNKYQTSQIIQIKIQFCQLNLQKQNKIKLFIQRAQLIKDQEIFGKMNIYFVLYNQENIEIYKSPVILHAGLEPNFNKQVQIPLQTIDDKIIIQIFDKQNFKKDDLVGECSLNLFEFYSGKNTIKIWNKYKEAGILYIKILNLPSFK